METMRSPRRTLLKEEDGDDEKSEEDSIEYPTSGGDDDAVDDGDDLSEDDADDEDEEESSDSEEEEEDDADDEDEEESSDSEEEEEVHLALTVPAPTLYSFVSASEETEPFEEGETAATPPPFGYREGETAATPPPFGYRIAARISVQPNILMPFRSESMVERLLAIPTPPLSPVSPTSYPLPPFLMPLPIFTPLPTSLPLSLLYTSVSPTSYPLPPFLMPLPIFTPLPTLLPLSLPYTSGSESIPEADIPFQKRALFTTPTGGYEEGESSVATAARQIRPALTIADRRRADDRLIGRLRRERRYFCTFTLQRQHIDDEDRLTRHIQHEHAQRDVAPEDGDSCS
nr:hypothetical protein [Tanacetum cinerariifolium]